METNEITDRSLTLKGREPLCDLDQVTPRLYLPQACNSMTQWLGGRRGLSTKNLTNRPRATRSCWPRKAWPGSCSGVSGLASDSRYIMLILLVMTLLLTLNRQIFAIHQILSSFFRVSYLNRMTQKIHYKVWICPSLFRLCIQDISERRALTHI